MRHLIPGADLSLGAFVAASIGGLLWGLVAFALRIGVQWVYCKRAGQKFDSFQRPALQSPAVLVDQDPLSSDAAPTRLEAIWFIRPQKGKFY